MNNIRSLLSFNFLFLFVFFLLYLAFLTALSFLGLATIYQVLIAYVLLILGILNNYLSKKEAILRKPVLLGFLSASFLLVVPVLIDAVLVRLSDYAFVRISVPCVSVSTLIFLTLYILYWWNYLSK